MEEVESLKDEADRKTVLVVDDSVENIDILNNVLRPEYDVKVALSGEQALEIAVINPIPDMILLDIMMPDMDGYEVCRRFKADQLTAKIPVIFVTARTDANDEQMGLKLGAADYITKPFSPAIVRARLHTHLALYERSQKLESMNVQLQREVSNRIRAEKMAALGTLVAGIAHEINTPLGVCIVATSHLAQETANLKKKYHQTSLTKSDIEAFFDVEGEGLELILTNLQRAADQIKNFKLVAVDQSKNMQRHFNIKEYIEEVIQTHHAEFEKNNILLTFVCPEDLFIESFPELFSQLFSHLILNSVKHGFADKNKGHINVKFEIEEDSLLIDYVDDGKGLNVEESEHLFDPFFTTKRGNGYSGLGGMIICNIVTHALKGKLEYHSEFGEGLSYHMCIPLRGTGDFPS